MSGILSDDVLAVLAEDGLTEADLSLSQRIELAIADCLAKTKAMAEMAPRDENGCPQCFACGRKDGLRCVAPGWGGVWKCRSCEAIDARTAALLGKPLEDATDDEVDAAYAAAKAALS